MMIVLQPGLLGRPVRASPAVSRLVAQVRRIEAGADAPAASFMVFMVCSGGVCSFWRGQEGGGSGMLY